MPDPTTPVAVVAAEVPARGKRSVYPEPFASRMSGREKRQLGEVFALRNFSRMSGREKRQLGEVFALRNFGVNLTCLAPHAVSALRHAHSRQDEFVYILEGHPTLHTDEGRTLLSPGMCAGFKAGTANGHCLINETTEDVVYLEVGDRASGDEASYPDDDLKAVLVQGQWQFTHRDGTPYR